MKKFLGIDWGEKRIGLALGDSETKIATPFCIVSSLDEVLRLIKEEEVECVVIGKPYSISNLSTDKQVSKIYSTFLKSLKEKAGVDVFTIDERLSSKAADALVGTKKTKASRDSIAAMIILQSYLDRLSI